MVKKFVLPKNKNRISGEGQEEFREEVADLCHAQWAHWMAYLFSLGEPRDDGTFVIPSESYDRWLRQSRTDYDELSEEEKESDRKEADRFIELFEREGD